VIVLSIMNRRRVALEEHVLRCLGMRVGPQLQAPQNMEGPLGLPSLTGKMFALYLYLFNFL
jgi:hypothetical protein